MHAFKLQDYLDTYIKKKKLYSQRAANRGILEHVIYGVAPIIASKTYTVYKIFDSINH